MQITGHRVLRLCLLWAAVLLLVTFLTSCGGSSEDEENGDPGSDASRTETASGPAVRGADSVDEKPAEDEDSDADARAFSLAVGKDLLPSNLLNFLLMAFPEQSENILYVDVQAAKTALQDHRDVGQAIREEWDERGGQEWVDILDLEFLAFGEGEFFLLGGLDTEELRGELPDAGFERDDVGSVEFWQGERGRSTQWHGFAFLGDTALAMDSNIDSDYEIESLLGLYETATSNTGRAGELWSALPSGIVKQLAEDPRLYVNPSNSDLFGYGQTVEQISDDEFGLTSIWQFDSPEAATLGKEEMEEDLARDASSTEELLAELDEDPMDTLALENLESYWFHTDCEGAEISLEGARLRLETVCSVEALFRALKSVS